MTLGFPRSLTLLGCLCALGGCGGFGAMRSAGPAYAGSGGESSYSTAEVGATADVSGGGPVATPGMAPPPSATVTPSTSTGAMTTVPPTAVTATTTTTTTVTVTTLAERAPVDVEPVEQTPQYAQLTAASVSDTDRRENYLEYLSRHAYEAQRLGLDMSRRVRVRVLDRDGQPVNDAALTVRGLGGTVEGRTHADGTWDFHPSVASARAGRAVLAVQAGQVAGEAVIDAPSWGDGADVLVRLNTSVAVAPRVLDLAFAIDVTGSMEDELRYVNHEIAAITERIRRDVPEATIRVGAIFYRDRVDRFVVQQIQMTEDVAGFAQAMRGVTAGGGGDYPEDMNAGLDAAMNRLAWTDGNAVRVLVLVADAPPKTYQDSAFTYRDAMVQASARGIRILPVAASGADRSVEYLFRAMGSMTSTPYVYLTDDSGIGNPHIEADTDRVAVEMFSELLARLVISDMAGRGMHEPGPFGPS